MTFPPLPMVERGELEYPSEEERVVAGIEKPEEAVLFSLRLFRDVFFSSPSLPEI